MFKHLQEIEYKLYERYLTLEKNIKAGSNSFYDAYLDLQEQFVKGIAVFCEFDIKARETCGELLRREDIKNFFKDVLLVGDFTYTKMQDYTLKVNAHKHKGEKNIQIDTIVSYMRIIYNATSSFAVYKNIEISEFDANYFISIFGAFEKENAVLKTEMGKLKEELLVSVESGKLKDSDIIAYKSLLSQSEIDKLDLEEQNQELHRQISKLKDIKLSSMEEKLNKTIDLLHQLGDSVVENRAVAYAVGDTICGRKKFEEYVDGAKKLWKKAKDGVDKVNETLGIGVAVTKGINEITKLFTGEEDE
jgi:hypothetical protein